MTYQINTERLLLRLLSLADLDPLCDLEADAEVKQFFPDGPRDRVKTEEMIKRFMSYYEEKKLPNFLLFDRLTNEFIGRAGFGITDSGEIEIGYVLHKKFWGKGYAAEAVKALLKYARANIDVDYIIAYADFRNTNSLRIMEKCGMRYDKTGIAKGIECKFYKISNR